MELVHPMHRTGDSAGQMSAKAKPRYDIFIFVQIHVFVGVPRCFFPEIERSAFSIVHSHHCEATAPDVPSLRIGHSQGKLDRYRRIDGIAAQGEYFTSYPGGGWIGAHHHIRGGYYPSGSGSMFYGGTACYPQTKQ